MRVGHKTQGIDGTSRAQGECRERNFINGFEADTGDELKLLSRVEHISKLVGERSNDQDKGRDPERSFNQKLDHFGKMTTVSLSYNDIMVESLTHL